MNTEVLMDVRTIIPRERHPKIFSAWDALPVGSAIKLVNDHNPKPLYYQFKAEHDGEFEWTLVESGPEKWVALIKRVAESAATASEPGPERPRWTTEQGTMLDVREELRAGGEPLVRIMAAAARILPGKVLIIRATFEPRPLYHVLGSKGFTAWAERLCDEDWKIYFLKKERHGGCGCGGHHGQERTLALDVSGLEPPEPMVRILQEIQGLKEGETLEVSHHRDPVPLYAQLEEAGFSHETKKLGENKFRIRIKRKHG